MAIDTKHFKKLLLEKQQELTEEVGRLEENVRDSRAAEVEDPLDAVTSSQAQGAAASGISMASENLTMVQDALLRLEAGTYGKCVECDRPIPEKRLEAVPWTPYCIEDQEKYDRAAARVAQ